MPTYLDQLQAREALAEIGIDVSERQIRRACEPDPQGRRKLPFFKDPIDGRLKIERETLLRLYLERQLTAERSCPLIGPPSLY